MLKIYKNFFYSNNKAFRETEPENQDPLPEDYLSFKPKNLKVDQLRFGLDYYCDNIDVNVNLKTFYDKNHSDNVDTIWVTLSLPNNKHIDWVLQKNKIQLEYFIQGYGYTNYLFQTIYKGQQQPIEGIKSKEIIKSIKSNHIWLYDCNHSRSIEKYKVINDMAPELLNIFQSSNELIQSINNLNIQFDTDAKNIHSDILKSEITQKLTQLVNIIKDFNLSNHPIFNIIHNIQCEIHQTKNMFELEKLWAKKVKQ